jgi:hypothetical protein
MRLADFWSVRLTRRNDCEATVVVHSSGRMRWVMPPRNASAHSELIFDPSLAPNEAKRLLARADPQHKQDDVPFRKLKCGRSGLDCRSPMT